jgi:PAS domain S-box-containing protein
VEQPKIPMDDLISENQHLRERLAEAEELLEAIRTGRVDAVVVSGKKGEMVYTLKGADHTYRVLIETMDEGAAILSENGIVLYCNRRFAEILQRSTSEIVGRAAGELVVLEDRQRFRDLHRRVYPEGGLKTEMRFITGDADLPVLVSLSPLHTEDMQAVCMVVTDLSELKHSQQTLRAYSERLYRKNMELRHRAEQLARLSAELTMTEQRERRRISKILHDGLQQQLAAAKLQLGGMAEQIGRSDLKGVAYQIEEMVGESIRMARSLSADLSPPILHAGGIVAGMEWLVRWMADMHDFAVDLDLCTQTVHLNEDVKILVFESVRELLFNAVKHSRAIRAALRLEAVEGGDRVKITISDKGQGFDPVRLQTSTENNGGLGLFSIRERIGLIGGVFKIDSAPGRGSRFTLIVPRSVEMAKDPMMDDPVPAGIDGGPAESPVRGPFIRVLLADDHTLFRDGMARLLSKEPNIEVVGQAADGRAAVELARKLTPHVILMDVSMPEIDGVEATRIIHQQAPHIRIIGLSMYEDEERAQVMYDAGAVGYKSKTCPAAELIAAVLT